MTAAEHLEPDPGTGHSLLIGVSPRTIDDALFQEDRLKFRIAYEAALDEARRHYDLGPVHEVVEHWRQIAVLQSDPEAFRDSVRSVAEMVTGTPSPDGEPFEVTRAKAGM